MSQSIKLYNQLVKKKLFSKIIGAKPAIVVIDVRKIALNLASPALKIASSNDIPSFKFELNFEIKTSPSLTNIPMRAIIPRRDITFTGKL